MLHSDPEPEPKAMISRDGPRGDRGPPQSAAGATSIADAKGLGEQPAVLANLALANQIANANLAQQNAIAQQQALFQVQLALVAKCVDVIAHVDPSTPTAPEQLRAITALVRELLSDLNQASKMHTPEQTGQVDSTNPIGQAVQGERS